jgi:hypothetical protein
MYMYIRVVMFARAVVLRLRVHAVVLAVAVVVLISGVATGNCGVCRKMKSLHVLRESWRR